MSSNNIFDYFHPMPLCCYKWMNYFDYDDLSKILSYHKTFSFFFELDLFSHSLAASWSFLTKKSEVSFFSGPGPALSTLTQHSLEVTVTLQGIKSFFLMKNSRFFIDYVHYCLLNLV